MRKRFFIVFIITLLFLGCGQENKIVMPQDGQSSSSSAATGQVTQPEHSAAVSAFVPQPFVQENYPTEWVVPAAEGQTQAYQILARVETKSGPYEEIQIERIAFDKETARNILSLMTQASDVSLPPEKVTSVIRVGESAYEVLWRDSLLSILHGTDAVIQPERWVLQGNAYPDEPAGTRLEHVNIQQEQAEAIAKDFLSEIGVSGYICVAAEKARLLNGAPPFNTFSEGWQLIFVKDYEHYVSLAYDSFDPNLPELQLEQANRLAPYKQESIVMLVNEEGCQAFLWSCPSHILQQNDCGIPLLPFAQVQDVMNQLLTEGCHPPISDADRITVTELTLCTGMTKDPDDPNRSILIPMWAASYTTENMISDGHVPGLLCIDARTGERINPLIH